VVLGVVALAGEDGQELGAGAEVGAGLAGRFQAAVQLGGAGAQAVTEHPGVGLAAQLGHAGGLVVGGQLGRLAVERVDLGGDGGVLVGDDPVGDLGVDQGHLHFLVAEQGGDGLQPHAAVDGLGSQGVAEPVGVHARNARGGGDAAHDPADDVPVQDAAVVGDQPLVPADVLQVRAGPRGQQCDQVGVQGHVPVVAELAERDPQPVPVPDLHDRVRVQVG